MATSSNTDLLGLGKIQGIIKWLIVAGVIVVLIIIAIKVRNYFKDKSLEKQINATVTTTTNGVPVSVPIGTIAANIKDAFYNYWGGEDEERAISELLNCPKALIPKLSEAYFSITEGKSLKGDFIKYLDTDEFNKVRTHLS